MERDKINKMIKKVVAVGLVAGSLLIPGASSTEAMPPLPGDDPVLPYPYPEPDFAGRREIPPLPKHKIENGTGSGGGRNDRFKIGPCGTVFQCRDAQ